MSEERKEGVRAVSVSRLGSVWTKKPSEDERRLCGPFHTAYLHEPPEGAPEPGERRMYKGEVVVARHVFCAYNETWYVAYRWEWSGRLDAHRLDDWLALPLAPPKPKYRIPETVLTDEEAVAVNAFLRRDAAVACFLRIEEIPE